MSSDGNLSESDEEALSQECIIEMSSQESLSSGDTGKPARRSTSIESIPLTLVDPIPESILKFAKAIQQEPFYTAVKEFRSKWKKHHVITRLVTPSACVATDKAEQMRLEFSCVVEKQAPPELQSQWLSFESDVCDKFLCHLFLPPSLGGFFPVYED